LTKFQILEMDFGWLGGGRIRFGFQLNGKLIHAAQYIHTNVYAGVHMSNPNQPLRWEILGVSSAAAVTMEAICGKVQAEGGYEARGVNIAHDTDGILKAVNGVNTFGELLAVRLTSSGALVGNSIPRNISVICPTGGNFMWELWLNVAGMTGGTWAAPSAAITEQNSTRTGTYTAGTGVKLASGYSVDLGAATVVESALLVGLGYDINAAAADILSVRVMNFAGNNDYAASINMRQDA
jgi:hypothetical protein